MNMNFYFTTAKEIFKQCFHCKSDYDFIKNFTSVSYKEYKELKQDLKEDKKFFGKIEDKYYLVRKKKISIKKYEAWNKLIYYLIRAIKPVTVIETGVFDGITTSFFLKALKDNGKGHLYSIDLPAYDTINGSTHRMDFTTLPGGLDVGWVIPEDLKKNWTLYKGPSSEHLEPLLKRLGVIDFFLHDSLHTYENMLYEYETVWPFLKDGGILASDDIMWNPSFQDFSEKVNREYMGKYKFGALKK